MSQRLALIRAFIGCTFEPGKLPLFELVDEKDGYIGAVRRLIS